MRKIKTVIVALILVFALVFITKTKGTTSLIPLFRNSKAVYHRGTTDSVMIPQNYTEKNAEFRGVWVPTVYNLAMPKHTSEAQYKAAFRELIARVKSKNLNAILFQTRPLNDTFYESEYAPYSRYFVGPEGVAPGWDAMGWMVDYAHSQGIQFHAWMNPYRVANSDLSKTAYLKTLHADNFAKKHPEFVISGNQSDGRNPYILDPGRPEVIEYIQNVVQELVEKYDVDGVHFDDYFYPYSGTPTTADDETFALHNPGGLSRNDWRRKNVDDAVKGVKLVIDNHNEVNNKNVKFGISPFGIWRNKGTDPRGSNTGGMQSYDTQYADSRNWVINNWVDYITPQIYWTFTGTPAAPYADVTDWWANLVKGTHVDLIVGHSITSTGLLSDELATQLRYNQKHPEIKGSILYSSGLPGGSTDYLNRPVINTVISSRWTQFASNIYEPFIVDLDEHYATTLKLKNYTTTSNIELITSLGDYTITWESSNPDVISNIGVVTRPPASSTDALVELKATNQAGRVATYYVNVPKEMEAGDTDPTSINPPTYNIIGELIDGVYEEPITIKFSADLGLKIEYLYTDGNTTTTLKEYTGPITFDKRGGYVFTVYATDPITNMRSEPLRFNVILKIPYDESAMNVIRNGVPVKFKETGRDIYLGNYIERPREVRAVWVATVSNIDVPRYQNDEQYKAFLIDMLDTVKSLNMNTVFFQVRSMNDAFYPSKLAPYSQYIKGISGEGLDWDILEFVVEEAHKRDIELHAWLNPYRIMNARTGTIEEKLNSLHMDNFARKNPELVMEDKEGALILNPGEPQVRQYIYDVIQELIENYPIDGIHMDDYFYTYGGHLPEHDIRAFNNYNPDNLSLAEWRMNNIDILVKEIFEQVERANAEYNRHIKWGISPIGIWRSIEDDPNGSYTGRFAASSYRDQFANTRKWVKEGWLHYINPQVYWEFARDIAPYADIVKWWNDQAEGTDVKVLVGQGFYRMIENNTSMNNENEMIEQIRFNQRYRNVIGTVFFSYRTLKSTNPVVISTLERLQETYWTKPATWPWATDIKEPDSPEVIAAKDILQTLIDEIRAYILTVNETEETDPKNLNKDQLYSTSANINIMYDEIVESLTIIENRGYKVPAINYQKENLQKAFNTFKNKIIIGTGEEVDLLVEINASLDELEALIQSYKITTNTNPSALPKGEIYVTLPILTELNAKITEFRNYIAEDRTNAELQTCIEEVETFKTTLNDKVIVGTKASFPMWSIYAIGATILIIGIVGITVIIKKKKS